MKTKFYPYIIFTMLALVMAQVSFAQCATSVVYFTTNNPGNDNRFSSYAYGNSAFVNIKTALPVDYNALGYNQKDGFLYAVSGTTLFKVTTAGVFTNLGTITGLPASPGAGTISPSGIYYLGFSGGTTLYRVDLNVTPYTATSISLTSAIFADIAYNPYNGFIYSSGGNVVKKIDPVTGTVTSLTPTSGTLPLPGATGTSVGQWFNTTGTILYIYNDDNGKVGKYTISTGAAATEGTSPTTIFNGDAAACANGVTISGTAFDDANGLTDNTVNGTGTNAGTTLYAILYDNTAGTVVDYSAVSSSGTYTLNGGNGDAFSVYLSTTAPVRGQTATPALALPSGWVNTGSQLGAGAASNSTPGVLSLGAVSANTTNANFGIDQLPTANSASASYVNPGGTNTVQVPTLTGTDPEDGTYNGTSGTNTIIINTLPSNGTLYYNGTAVTAGQTISNYSPALLNVDPADNITTLTFTYSEVDAALKSSSSPATATITFTPFGISGNVYNDFNGLTDNIVNGTGTNAGGLNAVLVNTLNNTVVASTSVSSSGSYSFTNILVAVTCAVRITTNTATVGAAPPAVVLPSGWINTGENWGAGSGSDGNPNGILSLGLVGINATNVNFGIEQLPSANNASGTFTNPGGTNTVTVPTLTGSDPEDGTYNGISGTNTIKIVTLPASGTLYYNGTAVTAGQTISNYSPALLTYDPPTGAGTYTFTYSEVDAAGKSGATPATVTLNINALTISGNVYDDANGLKDSPSGTVNGTGTNAGGLKAVLIDAGNKVVASTTVNSSGIYSFSAVDIGSYSIEITTNTATVGSTPPVVAVPSGWVTVGENLGNISGNDGTVDGKLSLGTVNANVSNANFGIDQLPSGVAISYQINPAPTRGSTHSLTSAYRNMLPLGYYDPEDCASVCPSSFGVVITALTQMNGNVLAYNGTTITTANLPFKIPAYNSNLLTVTFNQSGISSFTFHYQVIDVAGVQSIDPDYTAFWGGTVLAVNLLSFTAEQQAETALLKWSTAGSTNDKFTIERSADSRNWSALKTIAGTGNSNTRQEYSYTDNSPLSGDNYYRIKQVDKDDDNVYSETRLLKFAEKWKVFLSPNPVVGGEVMLISNQVVSMIRITDLQGRTVLVKSMPVTTAQGSVNETLNTGSLASGTYLIQVVSGSGKTQTLKLVKW